MSSTDLSARSEPVASAGRRAGVVVRRLPAVAVIWVAVAVAAYLWDLSGTIRVGLTDGVGRPFGDDYINYWSAAVLAWNGRAAEIYDLSAFHAFQTSVVGPTLQGYHYSYPPVLLILSAPLALLPYVPGLAFWLGASWLAFYRALRQAAPRHALLLSLATPAVFINAVGGQNGAWTAALMGGGLALLDRRPVLAGSLFGLLVYKPHLALMLPVALLAGRRWRAFCAAGSVASALVLLSSALFGLDAWRDYLDTADYMRRVILEDGAGVWHRMVSVFAAARRLGLQIPAAYVVQAFAALAAALIVAAAWARDAAPPLRNAVVVLGALLATPYLQDYDLVVTAFAAVWIVSQARATESGADAAFACAALLLALPLAASPFAALTGLAIGPAMILPGFVWVTLATFAHRREAPET